MRGARGNFINTQSVTNLEKPLVNMRALKTQDYEKPNIKKQFLIGLGNVNLKMKHMIKTPQPKSKVGQMSNSLRQNPVDLIGLKINDI